MNRSRYRTTAVRGAVALLAVGALMLGGCSSTSTTQKADVSQEGLSKARADLASWLETPDPNFDVPPLPKLPAGTNFVFIKCGVPTCLPYLDGASAAAEAAGVKMTVLDAGNTPESQTRAWDQAVSMKPDAVLEVGFQLSLFSKQLEALSAAGIPVVTAGDTAGEEGIKGAFDLLPAAYFESEGEAEANLIIDRSEGKADTLLVSTNEVSLLGPIAQGFDNAMKENCPACTVDHLDIQLANIGRTIPGEIVSYLQRHPDVKWINLTFGALATGVPEALRGAGITGVNITSSAGDKLNWAYMKAGDQYSDLATALDIIGWYMFDAAVRLAAGEKTPDYEPKEQILFKDQITFDTNGLWPAVPGFEQKIVDRWKLSS